MFHARHCSDTVLYRVGASLSALSIDSKLKPKLNADARVRHLSEPVERRAWAQAEVPDEPQDGPEVQALAWVAAQCAAEPAGQGAVSEQDAVREQRVSFPCAVEAEVPIGVRREAEVPVSLPRAVAVEAQGGSRSRVCSEPVREHEGRG